MRLQHKYQRSDFYSQVTVYVQIVDEQNKMKYSIRSECMIKMNYLTELQYSGYDSSELSGTVTIRQDHAGKKKYS